MSYRGRSENRSTYIHRKEVTMDTTTTGVPLTAVALAFTRVVNYDLGRKEGWPM